MLYYHLLSTKPCPSLYPVVTLNANETTHKPTPDQQLLTHCHLCVCVWSKFKVRWQLNQHNSETFQSREEPGSTAWRDLETDASEVVPVTAGIISKTYGRLEYRHELSDNKT